MNKGLDPLLPKGNTAHGNSKAVRSLILSRKIEILHANPEIKYEHKNRLQVLRMELEKYDYAKFFLHDDNMDGKLSKLEDAVKDIENSLQKERFGIPMSGNHRD